MQVPTMMQSARFTEVNEPLKIEQIPVPNIKEDEVLVQVKAVGLCGSDIHIAFEGVTPTSYQPITLGHESSGIIAAKGSHVKKWNVFDRVAIKPFIFCGSCHNCIAGHSEVCIDRKVIGIHLDGALAEYIAIPEKNLIHLPEEIPFDVGAIITDAIATPFHAMVERAKLKPGESIVIYGAGGLGLHAVQIASLVGATDIIVVDIRQDQLKRAKELGATHVINPFEKNPVEEIKEKTNGLGVDLVAEFIGLQKTIEEATHLVKVGGRVVVAGLGEEPIKLAAPTEFVRKQITFLGSYGFSKNTIRKLVDLVKNDKLRLDNSITHRFTLNEVNQGLRYLHGKIENPIRIVITL